MKDLNEYLFLLTKRNPKRTFAFTVKGKMWKQPPVFVFQGAVTGAAWTQRSERGTAKPLTLELNTLGIPVSSHYSFEVCEHLTFISIYSVHPLARCILRWLLLCITSFWLLNSFTGMLYFCITGETFMQIANHYVAHLKPGVWYVSISIRASLLAQWQRTCLPVQDTGVRSLV